MSVYNWRELPRVNTHKIGELPKMKRTFVVTLNTPDTSSAAILDTLGLYHGVSHPEKLDITCSNIEVNEGYEESRYHVEVVADYEEYAKKDSENDDTKLPWERPAKWTFQTQGVAVPALAYYDGSTQKPLVNSANDFFEGLTVDEAQQKIIIESNRQYFPSAIAAAVTNCLNDETYLGFAQDCVKVQGISGEQAVETIKVPNADQTGSPPQIEVQYWKIKAELLCRQTGWNLLLPDVGFNYIAAGVKKRAFVTDENGQKIASANPIALNGSGGISSGLPAVLTRRIYKRVTMSTYFGTPPATS
jgi:hypothetical protein